MSVELPRRSLAAYAVQPNCVCFPQDIIEKHSLVDVAPIPGVNHVKTCVLCDECLCLCLFTVTYYLHMSFVIVNG